MAEQSFSVTISDIDGPEDRDARLFDAVADLVLERGFSESFVSLTTEPSEAP